jgi:hypothetical protein
MCGIYTSCRCAGGHAAHFANVLQRSPFFRCLFLALTVEDGVSLRSPAPEAAAPVPDVCPPLRACPATCSQERAPTSVAYAETQSMFLDSLAGDAAWLGRFARNRWVGWVGAWHCLRLVG